jgi:hypothetical protein
MSHVYRTLWLWLLLVTAQQGAVVHELSHCIGADGVHSQIETTDASDRACALCPAFAQVSTPAFSHALPIPPLVRAKADRFPELRLEAIEAAVPTPRSRGPPLSS